MFLKQSYMTLVDNREELYQKRLEVTRRINEGLDCGEIRSSLLEELRDLNHEIRVTEELVSRCSSRGGCA